MAENLLLFAFIYQPCGSVKLISIMWHTRERTFVQMFLDFIIATFFSSHMMYSWEEHLTNHKSPPDGYCQKGWQHRVETIIFEHLKQLKTKPPPGSPTVISLSIVFNRGGCIEMSLWTSQLAVKRTTERLFFLVLYTAKREGFEFFWIDGGTRCTLAGVGRNGWKSLTISPLLRPTVLLWSLLQVFART